MLPKPSRRGPVVLLILAGMLPLCACATRAAGAGEGRGPAAPLEAAVTQPLDDLNLAAEDPAAALVAAYRAPERVPASCAAAAGELARLARALDPNLLSQPDGADAADVAASVVRSVLRLPFRGVVRQLSGAEQRAKARQAMLYAGMLRRGYLTGWRVARPCEPPAAQVLALPPQPRAPDPRG
jgi:hypothetical protein